MSTDTPTETFALVSTATIPATPSQPTTPTRKPTLTASPTPKPTATKLPVSTNTPEVTPTSEVQWIEGLEVQEFDVQTGRQTFSDLYPVPTPIDFGDEYFSLSPQQTYRVECAEDNTLRLFKHAENQLIYEQSDLEASCLYISWREDEVAFSVTVYDQVYVWRTNGTAPYQVASGAVWGSWALWSPDGLRLTIPKLAETGVGTVDIAYFYGFPQYATGIRFDCCNEWNAYIPWITNEIIQNRILGLGYNYFDYFDINTGKLLVSYGLEIFSFRMSTGNFSSLSPDKHWLIVDTGNYYGYDPNTPKIQYSLLDTTTKKQYLLSENPELAIEFLEWTPNSSRLLVISRPLDETSRPDPLIPSGLLALEPFKPQFIGLAPGVMYAKINPQNETLFALQPNENGQLIAAMYKTDGELIATFQPVTDQIPYLNPGMGLPVPVSWSNDGTQLVFSDIWGSLWLADTTGNLQQLAPNIGFSEYFLQPQVSWSPDDTHILITLDDRAWILALP
ncbi:MAG TPA: hypothetical protein PK530_14320 [Anaerolineales bacterium]|nr:hypothetical protein [Anaerolineales bacterium]